MVGSVTRPRSASRRSCGDALTRGSARRCQFDGIGFAGNQGAIMARPLLVIKLDSTESS